MSRASQPRLAVISYDVLGPRLTLAPVSSFYSSAVGRGRQSNLLPLKTGEWMWKTLPSPDDIDVTSELSLLACLRGPRRRLLRVGTGKQLRQYVSRSSCSGSTVSSAQSQHNRHQACSHLRSETDKGWKGMSVIDPTAPEAV